MKFKGKKYRECSNIKACMSVHCPAPSQFHAKWKRGRTKVQHSAVMEPMKPGLLWHFITTEPWFKLINRKKQYMTRHILQLWTNFCVQDCRSRIAQVESQSQTLSTRILDCKPFNDTCYLIGHRLESEYFHLAQVLLSSYSSTSKEEALRTWNLGQIFEIKLWVVGQWQGNTIDNCLQRQTAHKIFKTKIEAHLVNAGLYMAFKRCISCATKVAG